jgi:hypothetical protein
MNIQDYHHTTDERKKPTNIVMATLAGLIASIIGTILYALYPFIFGMQLSLLAIGVGGIVGLAIHLVGKGKSRILGIIGAFLALASCIAGDVISVVAIYSFQNKVPLLKLLGSMNLFSIIDILSKTTYFIGIMFYGMAMVVAYGISTMPPLPNISQNSDNDLGKI